jgi:hypothetical protein
VTACSACEIRAVPIHRSCREATPGFYYLVGEPSGGAFTELKRADTEDEAIAKTEKNYGPVLDGQTTHYDDGQIVTLLIVAE